MDVAMWHRLEEASLHKLAALADRAFVARGLRKIENNPAHLLVAPKQRQQQRAVAAADIDHELVTAPIDALEAIEATLRPLSHRPVEGGALVRVRRQPCPELIAVDPRERRLAAQVKRSDRL